MKPDAQRPKGRIYETCTGPIVVEDVRPCAPRPAFSAKAVVGDPIEVSATVFKDGHDLLGARALLRTAGTGKVTAISALSHVGNDTWTGQLVATEIGAHEIVIEAWTDLYGTWAKIVVAKLGARQEVDLEVKEGRKLLEKAITVQDKSDDQASRSLSDALQRLRDNSVEIAIRVNHAVAAGVTRAVEGHLLASDLTASEPVKLWVDRERAAVGAWYELFPRSFGGFKGVIPQLDRIADLGFDVVYLPPVHPIGETFRKGRNNTLNAEADDPGSPWAIGSTDGGHTALHPDLGSFEDFDQMVEAASQRGLEIALDYALQCSPDHPWVKNHPEWFHHRVDGSIAYAENPPKKYQDIYPINFWPETEKSRIELWEACKAILDFWMDRGIRIFRVDNPHTKPIAFWEWLIARLREEHPDVVLLAEAFTRPKVMAKLAEVGFSQSYTYFTWRTEQYGKEGIRTYATELAASPLADIMRPNFWPNTPDILADPLRDGPPAAFAMRLVLAATLAPSYGIYSGYELFENKPASPSNEEYMHSEKYEIKHRDFDRSGTLQPFIRMLNEIRRKHPAFRTPRFVHFHGSNNPSVLAFSKRSMDGSDTVMVICTLDPLHAQESTLTLDLEEIGVSGGTFTVVDEISGETYNWNDRPYVRLEPWARVAHVLSFQQ